jgi:PAS domain S-box-containing protein
MQSESESSASPPITYQASCDVQSIQAELAEFGGGTDPFAAAVEATRMPMLITNPRRHDNPIVFVNDAFCRLTGYSRPEILGRNCRFLQGATTDPASIVLMRTAIQSGKLIEIDIQNHRKNASSFWNRLLMAPVYDRNGNVSYYFANQSDVTMEHDRLALLEGQNEILEQKVAERTRELVVANEKLIAEAAERQRIEGSLRQSQKMEAIGQLTGGIAHDFNNMLQGIASGIELAKRRIATGEPQNALNLLDAARDAVRRAAELTRRLLAFGRKQALDPKPIVLDDLVQEMADLIQQTVGPAITVDLRLQDGCWPVRCDPNQLENAILNVAINARDAMLLMGGRLLIETAHTTLGAADTSAWDEAEPGDYVRITVTDTGTGMTPDVLTHAFEPFFTTKPDGQGTGLGLSQLYGFMHQSRGVVQLESNIGVGTSVHLHLPRYLGDQDVHSRLLVGTRQATTVRAGVGMVLLVEDEPTIRELAAAALREAGYQVLEARNGHEGLIALQRSLDSPWVDLLVTDVGLPGGLNGRQLAEAARALLPSLPVLLITGYAGDPSAALGHDKLAPGMEVLSKPFQLDVLAERVRTLIGRNRDRCKTACKCFQIPGGNSVQ